MVELWTPASVMGGGYGSVFPSKCVSVDRGGTGRQGEVRAPVCYVHTGGEELCE